MYKTVGNTANQLCALEQAGENAIFANEWKVYGMTAAKNIKD
jgi:hypothetical protein